MLATARKLALVTGVSLLLAGTSWAQTSALEGEVLGEDGKPLKGALVQIERQDIKGSYKVKTNKKGRYFHAGLPLGAYKLELLVEGRVVDTVSGVRTTLGEPTRIDFDLEEARLKREALQKAAASGQLTDEQMRGMTKEQREAIKQQMEQRTKSMRKNKALNDVFNAGMTAKQAGQWDVAVENFVKATEIDPEQHVVWANLADAYVNLADTKRGAEQEAAMAKGIEAYERVITAKPDDAAYHNNYGLALARAKRFDEAQAELEKAAQINPPGAGQYFYNLGAVLVNIGQLDPAGDAFQKAIEADPNYAPAQYQYGIFLISKAKTTPDGKIIPPEGTRAAFQKYLELQPNGAYAASAQGMLASLEGTLETEYTDPDAPKRRRKKQ